MYESFRAVDDAEVGSQNHHFLGDICSWFIQSLAGIKPNPNADDVSYIEISPNFIRQLDFAKAHFDSKFGRVSASWKRIGDKILLDVSIPDGITCDVVMPKGFTLSDGSTKMHLSKKANMRLTIR